MKNRPSVQRSLTGLALAIGALSVPVHAQDAKPFGYVRDQSSVVVRSASNLCVRTGYWAPSMATIECDPDLLPKIAQAPAPRPAPAPAPVAVPPAPSSPPPAPPAKPAPFVEKLTLSADTLFDFDKAVIRPDGKGRLDELLGKLRDASVETIIAVGHTDRIGSDAYNLKLSARRADAVKAYMVSQGIDPGRIHTEGMGEKQPVTSPGDCRGLNRAKLIACLQPDRRVVIEVVGTRIRP